MVTGSGPQYVAAIDQGTSSTRCIIFDRNAGIVASEQREHDQILPRNGWVEHDATQIWLNTRKVTADALATADLRPSDIAALGITNQRETVVVWDRATGEPIHNAIVWQDTRTADLCTSLADGDPDRFRSSCGLPLSTYFAGPKIRWILDNVPGARERAEAGELCAGTIDSWLMWNLTDDGGPGRPMHVTDITNASRTMLMRLSDGAWDAETCAAMGVPMAMLPEIRSSAEVYGDVRATGVLAGVPIAGILGDQQAAMFGQAALDEGAAKNTYGTGNFLLVNTGERPVFSEHGLLTTVCYRLGDGPTVYALEGSVAVSGSLVQWLRDNLGIISSAPEVETLARDVPDNGGVYVVPAFSGLFAPRWRPDARGVVVGLTRFADKRHIARASLEATAFQSREVIEAMNADSGIPLSELRVDGGMVVNDTLMQFQADVLGVPVVRPRIIETTALGAAYAAGYATRFWTLDEIRSGWAEDRRWLPAMTSEDRERLYADWNRAVERTLDWA
ncbi:glycerol kinase GlpK [Tsukamurella sp. 8F]|uniref:glycerol kinase GlpK n=1 Tax=unclassified Tsukamurella TaxID=2633480 RepID=UPI0023BA2641|nr:MULTISPECIES: glycerol kinase GlpK [unclassified Tsukamurella]MDF0528978.1 glycerol kinase GlpK [Tsukamurella sp. 8J]MDF0587351.1 glycerol kinase GlpK [Tsukamurella sp. 8F]